MKRSKKYKKDALMSVGALLSTFLVLVYAYIAYVVVESGEYYEAWRFNLINVIFLILILVVGVLSVFLLKKARHNYEKNIAWFCFGFLLVQLVFLVLNWTGNVPYSGIFWRYSGAVEWSMYYYKINYILDMYIYGIIGGVLLVGGRVLMCWISRKNENSKKIRV